MACGGRVKAEEIRADQKWDFISLGDFKSTSCFGPFAYAYLVGSLIVSIAVYGVDTFTAVNLLAYNKWSSAIEPQIPFEISKWIFSACIMASWINLGYEYFRAIRVIKRGAVAESYLDSLAVRIQCIRWTKEGRGWRRFLVFAELTKSKKGAEYVALFTYFSFQSWIRIIFCQGPRQVVNALTLYAVLQAQLLPTNANDVGSAIGKFFQNIGVLADHDQRQAVILSGMLFTLVIWVFGALSLILAILFYLLFLWHYIPNGNGGLSDYCELKINKRLAKIVSVKVNKAIEEEERKRRRADAKALKKGEKPAFGRQATIPTLFDAKDGDKLPQMPMLNRNDTMTTLPAYTSRPGTPSGQPVVPAFELDQLDNKRPTPSRNVTGSSFGSNAPLISNASDMGYGRSDSPAPSLPPLDRNNFPAPQRSTTANSQNGQWNRGPPRMPSAMGDRGYTASPVSYDNRPPTSSLVSNGSQDSMDSYGRPLLPGVNGRSNTPAGPAPSMGRRTPFDPSFPGGRNSPAGFAQGGSEYGRNSPAPQRGPPPSQYGRNSPAPARGPTSLTSSAGGYQAYNPNPNPQQRSASSATPGPSPYPSSGPGSQQYRNMTDPGRTFPRAQEGGDYFGSQTTGTPQGGPNIARLASPDAYNGGNASPGGFVGGQGGYGGGYRR